jgi:hypothetical protein
MAYSLACILKKLKTVIDLLKTDSYRKELFPAKKLSHIYPVAFTQLPHVYQIVGCAKKYLPF